MNVFRKKEDKAFVSSLFYLNEAIRDSDYSQYINLFKKIKTKDKTILVRAELADNIKIEFRKANLAAPLVEIDKRWNLSLNINCTKTELERYTLVPDERRTLKDIRIGIYHLSLLKNKEKTMSETILSLCKEYNYHILDSLAIVRTATLCGDKLINEYLLDFDLGPLTELDPTTSVRAAVNRIINGEIIAVIPIDNLEIIELKGNGFLEHLPKRYIIKPLLTLSTDGDKGNYIMRSNNSRFIVSPDRIFDALSAPKSIYCNLILFNSVDRVDVVLKLLETFCKSL